jgi:hypothetical protein
LQTRQQLQPAGNEYLGEFSLNTGLPVWRYDVRGTVIEKQILLPHLQNTVYVIYRVLSGESPVQLDLRPAVNFRPHEGSVEEPLESPYTLSMIGNRYEISAGTTSPIRRMLMHGNIPPLRFEGGIEKEVITKSKRIEGTTMKGYFESGLF